MPLFPGIVCRVIAVFADKLHQSWILYFCYVEVFFTIFCFSSGHGDSYLMLRIFQCYTIPVVYRSKPCMLC